MKKMGVIMVILFLSLTVCGTIYAAYKRGFVVVKTTEDSVTIKSSKANDEIIVKINPGDFKVGDEVKYDKKKNRLKPDILEGC